MKKKNINNNSPPLSDTPCDLPLLAPSESSVPAKRSAEPPVPENPVSEKFYPNSDTCKDQILSENTNKSGIYRFTNLTNGKRYVGSAVDLSNRLLFYYSPSKINSALQQGKSYICSAIIKYGLNNFSLEILE